MKLFIGADHRGYEMKKKLSLWLSEWGYNFSDLGALEYEPHDDYTHYASRVASMVAETKSARGILLCGSGVGVDVVANKFDGVRASFGKEPAQVAAGRTDDDMNVLVIAADFTLPKDAKHMVKVFLETKFDAESRHKKRLTDIEQIEANN
ncbi:hypothetical protein A2801_04310 [Candidatus Woesebacteria bacterium RIFCSPHIGHO2_01_FULL_41_10]|uniref:Ribose-5-phosphate isomerase n=1 Tax=Candidatus Woesebacteria bacterium RIFCSPHIGHO2_01_FULL_41_10 TaxID=1802500 RepID=A0A1F7YLK0_9BACT|nr:MAG: hypothetical protein A2801_04310 [Candidatus Woesebacteria bacterium RIFCSPHIGHO2_01_FULL_41_10]